MAINAYGQNIATNGATPTASNEVADKTALGKDDFMKLLLVELQHQDPTKPTDTEKILTQTSQLASLEASDNTNTALEELSASLSNSQQFSTISAIGKTADLGSDAISHDKGKPTTFEIYFPKDVKDGSVEITDANGKTIKTLDVGTHKAGVYEFTWDGTNNGGTQAGSAVYHVNATYTDSKGDKLKTKLGEYPIEAVRFDKGDTLLKVGLNYVPLNNIKEVY
ncbi:FlgD immunoglobulin-like domain containing protein [Sulfurimonas sp.]|uniref:FlgD immunoglobulin-like domain containing protein n=1 Tax=Sulfurimonas sp. TaxID=2022749 RepID=UPI00261958F6|nr:FlgD immunoglobulin-like domain containing protein [Sulfurimonas sp.]